MVVLRGRDSDSSAAVASLSPSPTAPAVVKIMSPSSGNKVIGGQAMRVAVTATGVGALQGMRLTVDGEPTGPSKLGAGSGDTRTVSFPWRPPARGGDLVLHVEAVLDDGSIVRSRAVRVAVRPAVVPTPTVTVTAQAAAAPTYESGDDGSQVKEGGELAGSRVVLISSETTYAEAEDWLGRLMGAGWENAGILNSDDYPDLRDGYYCPYVGPYYSYGDAADALSALKADGLGESPRIAEL
jgi:hypothetical protein